MSAHDVVGPSTRFSKGFPVVTLVTQINNNVSVFSTYTQDNGTIPIGTQTLQGRGEEKHVGHPKSKVPWSKGRQIKWRQTKWVVDGNKVEKFCREFEGALISIA